MGRPLDANIVTARADGGRIADNIVGFARVLRETGLPVGPQKAIEATEAVLASGIDSPSTLYWTLHAVFVSRPSERDIFNQAFQLIWRDPGYLQQLLSVMVPKARTSAPPRDAVARRLADSLFLREAQRATERDILQIDARGTASDLEVLAAKDFEQMTAEELRLARQVIAELAASLAKRQTRRYAAASAGKKGRLDLRRMLRKAGTAGLEAMLPLYKERQRRAPPLAVLCDISGSMESYARLFLHFLYGLINEGGRVHAFLFGTRLTNVTRILRDRDPDAAIAKVASAVHDWSGGTRIGASLHNFNKVWARRVLAQNAMVLLFTDGLDRSAGEGIAREARRLRASCRELIWLNPLLRYEDYEPLAAGAAELRQHVSDIRGCHNLNRMADLAAVLSGLPSRPRAR
ncbi:MAG TPA: VWA domain-containing protein [Hyphomicrobiales bacterium]|nr:VWA domain-containing protein [Hyphomicrobiales bacterium]